jgi:hypothetical protein
MIDALELSNLFFLMPVPSQLQDGPTELAFLKTQLLLLVNPIHILPPHAFISGLC